MNATDKQGLLGDILDALYAGRMGDYRELCLLYADDLEEQGDDAGAAEQRHFAETTRPAGVEWPLAESLPGLTDHQRDQLARTTSRRVGVLAGTPGTGKTYCAGRLVVALLKAHGSGTLALCAPTGKAAVRLTAAIRAASTHAPPSMPAARTIHQLLEIGRNGHDGRGWGFQRNQHRRLDQRFVLVDEASMLDVDLFASLLRALRDDAHLLLVGDPHQLPPVGHGAPLRDMIASQAVACGVLSEIQRNAGLIVRGCAAVKDGKTPELVEYGAVEEVGRNLYLVESPTPAQQSAAILHLVNDQLRSLGDIQLICALNRGSPIGRETLNLAMQAAFNFPAPCGRYHTGDRVICLKNGPYDAHDENQQHYVANGEMGRVVVGDSGRGYVVARFSDPLRDVRVPVRARDDDSDDQGERAGAEGGERFALGWAITCHKAQGSEWPIVIVALDGSRAAERVTTREWLYTAVSRASERCYLVGTRETLQGMLRRTELSKRRTRLAEMLRAKG